MNTIDANIIQKSEAPVIADNDVVMDDEIEAIRIRVREIEEEAEKLKKIQTNSEINSNETAPQMCLILASPNESAETDSRSVYVGNVDYAATAEELESHFHGCGAINRVTILCDKFSGHPKGFAYIEFADSDSVATALALDESLLKGRQIKVSQKRTNKPGISTTDRFPRGFRRVRGGRYAHMYRGRFPYSRPYSGRGRGWYYYSPY